MSRSASQERNTKETKIKGSLELDGKGVSDIATGIGFLDHMLDLLARHSGMDLSIRCDGDLNVDGHHTTEDIGIVIGKMLGEALGEKRGINRYGFASIPMDEALAQCSLDISGRPFLVLQAEFGGEYVGEFATELVEEFFRAVSFNAGLTLHLKCEYGANDHHKIEAMFKAFARALRIAIDIDEKFKDQIPSTKGVL
ncbi:MAG: imidazoleglycerol-phosphate dehydratase HisB [Clostridiales bacterium]|jgi:Imidazoleglycerol-phosphate dehydratase|nr:imidazoleglycerol-phosphate dehydratase HisB [Clostridiales bacterium]MBR6254629.1 imidazoleglycerol-phosphate dehydratase HisB [Clostridiales bacterium]